MTVGIMYHLNKTAKNIYYLHKYFRYMDWYNNQKMSNVSERQPAKQSLSKESNPAKTKKGSKAEPNPSHFSDDFQSNTKGMGTLISTIKVL